MRSSMFLALLLATAAPALAAPPQSVDQRVNQLEKELKAVQRKVFPGGAPAYFEPQIAPSAEPQTTGVAASQPLNDLTARVDGMERELSRITSQVEEYQHRMQLLSDQSAKDRKDFDDRLKALETAAQPPAPLAGAPSDAGQLPADAPIKPAKGRPVKGAPVAAPVDAAPLDKPAPAAAGKPTPSSGDPAEDAYMAGYKLWMDKKYPEAEAALEKVAKQYPKHKRASYARNLLGRAQLDEGKPATAAQTFLANYQGDPHGERAPESLFFLGQSLTQLKKTDNACRAYDELQEVYGATMSDGLKARIPAARKAAACTAK